MKIGTNAVFSTSNNVKSFKSPLKGTISKIVGYFVPKIFFNQKYNKGRYNNNHGAIDDINLYSEQTNSEEKKLETIMHWKWSYD